MELIKNKLYKVNGYIHDYYFRYSHLNESDAVVPIKKFYLKNSEEKPYIADNALYNPENNYPIREMTNSEVIKFLKAEKECFGKNYGITSNVQELDIF